MKRAGMTLIELLAVLAILSVLLVGTIRAMIQMGRSQKQRQAKIDSADPDRGLREMLRVDLQSAKDMKTGRNTFTLRTLSSLDPKTRTLRHHPAEVTYLVKLIGKRLWLVRRQKSLVRETPPREELLLPDVEHVALAGAKPSSNWGELPKQWKILTKRTDGSVRTILLPGGRQ